MAHDEIFVELSHEARKLRVSDAELANKIERIYSFAKDNLYPHMTLPGFPDHGEKHVKHVLQLADDLLAGMKNWDHMEPGESFLLVAAILLHDTGQLRQDVWYRSPAETHAKHAEESRRIVLENADAFNLSRPEAEIVSQICYSHGVGDYKTLLDESWSVQGLGECRLHCIMAILRIADLLDLAHSRAPSFVYGLVRMPISSKKHWERHAIIDDVRVIQRDRTIRLYAKPKTIHQEDALHRFMIWLNSELDIAKPDLRRLGLQYTKIESRIDTRAFCKPLVPTPANNPFPGLKPFGSADADSFFGREDQIAEVIDRMRIKDLLVIVGESGAGKTSLVDAGVFAELKRMGHTTSKYRFTRSIGRSFQRNLAGALDLDIKSKLPRISSLLERRAKRGAFHCVHIDQFEELFTLDTFAPEVTSGFKAIVSLLEKMPGLKILISMRSDFLVKLLSLSKRIPLKMSNEDIWELGLMSKEEARQAAEKPMRLFENLDWEGGLVQALLSDLAGSGPGVYPPYLSLVCRHLVDRQFRLLMPLYRSGTTGRYSLGLNLYEDLGKADSIINDHFQSILDGFSRKERVVIDQILSKMILESNWKKPILEEEVEKINADMIEQDRIDVAKAMSKLVAARVVKRIYCGYELLHDILARKLVKILQRPVPTSSVVQKVIEHIESNKSQPLSTDDLAKVAGLSPSQLRRKFQKELDYSPQQYRHILVLKDAKYLLQTTENNLTSIAKACGFSSLTVFSRVFKKYNKQKSPSEFRRDSRLQGVASLNT
ncbi:MAG: helix-turn-helix domain-containing protein [candidate division Zixibacteria bacterium]|nr:helix-turn-helix domain-containing protein [candidate division Zixibacteria bacterium]